MTRDQYRTNRWPRAEDVTTHAEALTALETFGVVMAGIDSQLAESKLAWRGQQPPADEMEWRARAEAARSAACRLRVRMQNRVGALGKAERAQRQRENAAQFDECMTAVLREQFGVERAQQLWEMARARQRNLQAGLAVAADEPEGGYFDDMDTDEVRAGHVAEVDEDAPVYCHICGAPATCFGTYEGRSGFACDVCCGHGCEDGSCKPIDAVPPPNDTRHPSATRPTARCARCSTRSRGTRRSERSGWR